MILIENSQLPAEVLYLQHAFRLSDDAALSHWVETQFWQYLIAKSVCQRHSLVDPPSLTRCHQLIGEEG
ncbi:hypothetical protein [Roseovarius sp. D0-M9]|uniref:hypothetical protein n=1 Tax=Roseovarius sp. D0-M9 TaxID=3127117 RepID=UPI00301024AE